MDGFTQGGVLLELLVTGWLAIGFLVVAVLGVVWAIRGNDMGAPLTILLGVVGAFCCTLMWVLFAFPFDAKYTHYHTVTGTVTDVSNTMTEASGEFTRVPVVTLDSVDRPLIVTYPGAVSLEGHEDVVLRCTIEWNYDAADTYSCKVQSYGTAE